METITPLFRSLRVLFVATAVFIGSSAASAQVLVLDTFNATGATGSVRTGPPPTSWVGNVTQNADSITVGGSARDDNGWGAMGQQINATGLGFLTVAAQRDSGHVASFLVVQFEDFQLQTQIITINASLFAIGALTQIAVPLPTWPVGFDATKITGWTIGGGTTGISAFRMTFHHLALSATATLPLHSADTNRDNRIALLELTRVIELYNTRRTTVRTGCYLVQEGTEDGFGLDPNREGSTTVTLASYHSADSDRDGKIGLVELTRVIQLYNHRNGTTRTGEYRAQSGTEDGFAPGP